MKIKYHEDDYRDGSDNFPREVAFLMKKHKCARRDIEIDTRHPCGEDVIFIKGVWQGYVDECLYAEMESCQTR